MYCGYEYFGLEFSLIWNVCLEWGEFCLIFRMRGMGMGVGRISGIGMGNEKNKDGGWGNEGMEMGVGFMKRMWMGWRSVIMI